MGIFHARTYKGGRHSGDTRFSGYGSAQVGKELFGAIRCPVLFVVGDADSHAPVLTVLEAKGMTANARLCVVPHAGHAAFLDNYPVTWAAVSQFLNAPTRELEKGAEPAKL